MRRTRNSHGSSRRGFTLVEILVVITIISLLAGLLLVGIRSGVTSAKNAQIKSDMTQLVNALTAYKTKAGSYPPCFGSADGVPTGSNAQRFVSHLRKAFPRYTITEQDGVAGINAFDVRAQLFFAIYGTTTPPAGSPYDLATLDQAETLVFWLGGLSGPAPTKLIGFSADVANPFQLGGSRLDAVYRFDDTRLVDQDGDGWWEYVLPTANPAQPSPPYVYFDGETYTNTAAGWVGYPNVMPPKGPAALIANWGSAVPYTGPAAWVNPDSFQLIAAGLDEVYSAQSPAVPHVYPAGLGYSPADEDNVTNFIKGATLGSDMP